VHVNDIEVDISFRFHCPVTGELVTGPEHHGPSSATAFLLGPEAEEFDFLSPELEPIWQAVRDAHDEDEQSPWQLFEEFCQRLEGYENLVLFSLTSSGIACGPVSSTVHVCIDFSRLPDDSADDDESDDDEEPSDDAEGDADATDGASMAPIVALPRHLPLSALERLLTDYVHVARGGTEEGDCSPFGMLVGYRDLADGEGFMGFEVEENEDEESCSTPLDRLRGGERLAIQLHDGFLADGVELIDRRDYQPTRREIRSSERLEESTMPGDPRLLPEDTGFYALGVGLEGGRLVLEPIAISCGMNGESLVRAAEYPESLRRRIAAYLARLA
jgi:hypothetical protein